MESKKKEKNNNLVPVIVVLAILLVGALGSTVYFYLKSNNETVKEKYVTGNSVKNNNTEKLVVENGFDNSKSLNTTGKTYTLVGNYANRGMNLSFDTTKKKMEVTLSACKINFTYHLGWVTVNEETCNNEAQYKYEKRGEISFSQEVSEFMIGGFGQDVVNDTMLFLMEDGTIEYIPIKKAYSTTSPEDVKSSYGTIPEVKDVIKLYQVSAGQYQTVLAQQADGSFYDLNESLTSINAWS